MKGQKLFGEFKAVMQENNNSMKITDRGKWWSRRHAVNTQLEVSFQFTLPCLHFAGQLSSGLALFYKKLSYRREVSK